MKKLILFTVFLSFPALAQVRSEVIDIKDLMVHCVCTGTAQVERVCIHRSLWAHDRSRMGKPTPDEVLTTFDASLSADGSKFILTTKAYYQICKKDRPPAFYRIKEIDNIVKDQKVFSFWAVKDYVPQMQIALVNSSNEMSNPYPVMTGEVTKEELNGVADFRGTKLDFYRELYPGTVAYEIPLERILGESALKDVVVNGQTRNRFVKIVLGAKMNDGRTSEFGVYTIKVHFYKKSQAQDFTALGIQLETGIAKK